MAFEKVKISEIEKITPKNKDVKPTGTEFEVQYNPAGIPSEMVNEYWSKTNIGDNVPEWVYAGGKGEKITLELWFDSSKPLTLFGLSVYQSVTKKYVQLKKWSVIQPPDKEPPDLLLQWGSDWEFVCTIRKFSEEFKLFSSEGTPLRALVKICFQQRMRMDVSDSLFGQNPTTRTEARKTWIVEHGQRLDLIAYSEYGDSSAWRHIAEVNNLDDPQSIYPGQILKLTPLA